MSPGRTRPLTRAERVVDAAARRLLELAPERGPGAAAVEFLVFGLKQAWACLFGGLMLAAILAARLWWPEQAPLARNDALVAAAVGIQLLMFGLRLETGREALVILLFHLAGTGMEVFKTAQGSWSYEEGGLLRIGGVPLFTGFMYAAVGSYLVRTQRLFDLRFDRYPRRLWTLLLGAAIYANFFAHHYLWDARWLLLAAAALLYAPVVMHYRVFRRTLRMRLLLAFGLVALFIWFAENIATWGGAWAYPDQLDGWTPVSPSKLVSWFLLMLVSVALTTLVHPPAAPPRPRSATPPRSPGIRSRRSG